MGRFGLLNKIRKTAKAAEGAADKLASSSAIARKRLEDLDLRLKKGLISKQSYDKLRKAELFSAEFLANPVKRNSQFSKGEDILGKVFWAMVVTIAGTTLFLKYKYGSSKPRSEEQEYQA